MTRHTAVLATTAKLPNGFQHSLENLAELEEGFRNRIAIDPFLNENHLEVITPIARLHDVYVAPLSPDDPRFSGQSGLYVTFEVLPGADPAAVERLIERGGLSIAFFGQGIGRGPKGGGKLELSLGLPADGIANIDDAKPLLEDLAASLPEVDVSVRRYHEHSAVATATLVLAVAWAGPKIADKILDKVFDTVWSTLQNKTVLAWRKVAGRVKLAFDTRNGAVHAVLPPNGEESEYRRVVRGIIDEVIALETGNVRRRVSFVVTESWTLEKHSEPLDARPNKGETEEA